LDLLLVGSIFIWFSKDVRDVFCTEKKHPIDKSPLCPVALPFSGWGRSHNCFVRQVPNGWWWFPGIRALCSLMILQAIYILGIFQSSFWLCSRFPFSGDPPFPNNKWLNVCKSPPSCLMIAVTFRLPKLLGDCMLVPPVAPPWSNIVRYTPGSSSFGILFGTEQLEHTTPPPLPSWVGMIVVISHFHLSCHWFRISMFLIWKTKWILLHPQVRWTPKQCQFQRTS